MSWGREKRELCMAKKYDCVIYKKKKKDVQNNLLSGSKNGQINHW
jgi:hypothetical protein